jgi:type VI secretion system protein VasG
MTVNLKSLISKLNGTCRSAMEGAAGICLSRTNYDVEIEHLLLKLNETGNTDVSRIWKHFGVEPARLNADLGRCIDRMKTGNARSPALSPRIVKLLTEAWSVGSLDYGFPLIRSGTLITSLLASEELARIATDISPEFQKISLETLRKSLPDIIANSVEQSEAASLGASSESTAGALSAPGAGSKTPNLDQYTIDLSSAAKSGKIDPVLGRDFEIRQIVDILTRRRQNNPILTGEAGVGKTAVVEGFALRVAAGDVPPPLRGVSIRTLDLGLLQAGAGVKGEFENRLKSVIAEVKASPQPIILFVDEAHTLIGAGGQAGQGDAANLLKPALARGELRTIAATTWSEYKKYFEKDAALARRFQVVKVEEPGERNALVMMRGLVQTLEKHHKVRILDEAVEAAVRLSHRYISGRHLPDKSVSVLDTASARVALSQSATPPAIEDCNRQIAQLETEARVLEREHATGGNHAERLAAIANQKQTAEAQLEALQARLAKERTAIQTVVDLRNKIEEIVAQPAASAASASSPAVAPGDGVAAGNLTSLRSDLDRAMGDLAQLQGEEPLIQSWVDSQSVAEVISGWTGIPVGKMVKDEIKTVLNLKDLLGQRVIGQPHSLDAIAQRIRTSRAGLDDPSRPIGVFLLVGPSGVGKTETALALADILYGGERNMAIINMSEYQEPHSVSGLKGSPPGYVGYGEGGVLTEAVRRKPYSVVLLDEMEKAHSDVMELFYQVFDKGMMEDGEGREVDFKNTVILMTSNAASDMMMKLCADPETRPEPEALAQAIAPELRKIFKPALLGRLIVVPYYPISDSALRTIIQLKLGKIRQRLWETHHVPFTYSEDLLTEVSKRCTEVESGARNVDHILTGTLLPAISSELLARMAEGLKLTSVNVGVDEKGAFRYEIG